MAFALGANLIQEILQVYGQALTLSLAGIRRIVHT
jgi:hypothetical protein